MWGWCHWLRGLWLGGPCFALVGRIGALLGLVDYALPLAETSGHPNVPEVRPGAGPGVWWVSEYGRFPTVPG
jgi:hypothetical protein